MLVPGRSIAQLRGAHFPLQTFTESLLSVCHFYDRQKALVTHCHGGVNLHPANQEVRLKGLGDIFKVKGLKMTGLDLIEVQLILIPLPYNISPCVSKVLLQALREYN